MTRLTIEDLVSLGFTKKNSYQRVMTENKPFFLKKKGRGIGGGPEYTIKTDEELGIFSYTNRDLVVNIIRDGIEFKITIELNNVVIIARSDYTKDNLISLLKGLLMWDDEKQQTINE